jgi:hypothetical protein
MEDRIQRLVDRSERDGQVSGEARARGEPGVRIEVR